MEKYSFKAVRRPGMVDDLTGRVFGRLTVIEIAGRRKDCTFWWCLCSCGSRKAIAGTSLKRAKPTLSCGCKQHEHSQEILRRHGMAKTPVYKVWSHMLDRCRNPDSQSYADYGGRGIAVCERWHAFQNFFADMGDRPSPKHSIERLDNDKGYEPGNCVWATRDVQRRNQRNLIFLEHDGRRQILSDWAKEKGINPNTLRHRIFRSGWPVERALDPTKGYSNGARRTNPDER